MSEEKQNPGRYPLGEPSVLAYVKSLLHLSGERIRIPEEEQPSIIDDRFLEERTLAGGSRGSAAAFQVLGSGRRHCG